MNRCTTLLLGTMAMLSVTSVAALAQSAPPTYQADLSVYKVIFEDQNFRVIEATWKKGENDKSHSHPRSLDRLRSHRLRHSAARSRRQDPRR